MTTYRDRDIPHKHRGEKIFSDLESLDLQRKGLIKKALRLLPLALLLPIVLVACLVYVKNLFATFIVTSFTGIFLHAIYDHRIGNPFTKIKIKAKVLLLSEYMRTYYSDAVYDYYPRKQDGESIVKKSRLIEATIYNEEDVMVGKLGKIDFYISQIEMKKKVPKSEYTLLKGMLFRLKLTERNFPTTIIHNDLKDTKEIFKNSSKHEHYSFFIDTENPTELAEKIGHLFPFFAHLMRNKRDVRIKLEGDEITILLESDIDFLDAPVPGLQRSLVDKEYYKKMSRNLNSFMFMVESIANDLTQIEVEEKLTLNALAYLKKDIR